MDDYLLDVWGENKGWKWRGFGQVGTEDFVVIVLRSPMYVDDEESESDDE
jgi:hypothetical protein